MQAKHSISTSADFNQGLIKFLQAAPSPVHAVAQITRQLEASGFLQLDAGAAWQLQPGQGYWLSSGGSVIAFYMGQQDVTASGLRLIGAHTDSPCLQVKPKAELIRQGCLQLGVEVYGGALLHPWLDRELSLAGQVYFFTPTGELSSALLDMQRPVGIIPSLAIHLNRDANKNSEINPQLHLPVVVGLTSQEQPHQVLHKLLAQELAKSGHQVAQVVDYNLCFYPVQPPALFGWQDEFISAARLDNLLSCYTGLQALVAAATTAPAATCLLVCNDHEEVGSASSVGAEGPFLASVLQRLAPDPVAYQRMLAQSLMVSCDNAHAVHPNYADKHDANHGPILNAGPVIKVNANQRYATSAETSALFVKFCQEAQVPYQHFVVRSDMACGSTIGPIVATQLGIRVVDVGAAQWAMHSARETAGTQDAWYLNLALQTFMRSAQV